MRSSHFIKRIASFAVLSMFMSLQFISTAYAGLTWSAYGSDIPMDGEHTYLVTDFLYDNAGTMHLGAMKYNGSIELVAVSYGSTSDGINYNWTDIETLSGDWTAKNAIRMKLDPSGDPGLIYYLDDSVGPDTYHEVKYVHADDWGTTYSVALVDTGIGYLDTPDADFSFASNGEPEVYICFDPDGSSNALYRHAWTGSGFPAAGSGTAVYTPSGGESCAAPKVEIDSTDKRFLVFSTGGGNTNGAVKYIASADGSSWTGATTIFSTDTDRINGADLVLDGSTEYPMVMSVLNASGTIGDPDNTIEVVEWNGSSWTTPATVASSVAGYEIPDDVMNRIHSVPAGYEYISWQVVSGDDYQTVVANNEAGSWTADVANTITDTGLFARGSGILGYDTPYNKVTVYNMHLGNASDNQFYQATSGDDAVTGGSVPEFKDYILVVTVLLALGMMTRQKELFSKMSA